MNNTKMDFESFLVDDSNKFAYVAAKNVITKTSGFYNPVFICGRKGVGKTHLLNAIYLELKKENPYSKIVYTTGEGFANDFIVGLKTNTIEKFRDKYRNCDYLLIDDIQFITVDSAIQEEFFHTFVTLFFKREIQMVFTADKTPREIANMQPYISAHLDMGLVADILNK